MTREEAIERWAYIAESVFWAEERIAKEWHGKLKAMVGKPSDEVVAFAKQYCKAVAEVIVGRLTDEQLAAIYEKEGGQNDED